MMLHLTPPHVVLLARPQQLHAVIAASVSIKSSQKLKKILEVKESVVSGFNVKRMLGFTFLLLLLQIILALGNYMNSSKRGAVYGFKLQSLDLVRCFALAFKVFLSLITNPFYSALPPFLTAA